MTDAEIVALVARALMDAKNGGAVSCRVETWDGSRGRVEHAPVLSINYDELAAAVVAALTEAGRLVPPDAAMNGKDEVAALERAYEACFLRPCNMAVFHSVLATHGWRLFRCQNPQKVKAHWLPDLDAEPTPWR